MTIRFGRRALGAAFGCLSGLGLALGSAWAEIAPRTPQLAVPSEAELDPGLVVSPTLRPSARPRVVAPALPSAFAPQVSSRPTLRPRIVVEEMPDLRWDHIDGSAVWTRAAMRAIDSHGQRLLETVPDDIASWCPAYPEADRWSRKAFWAGLLSTLAKHESTYRPTAVGGGNLWFGLVQIYPPTARGYGCQARTGTALKDGALNMSCAVRIMNRTVPRDNVVSAGMRGVAADWGPFHSRRKREDMRRWISQQPFCQGLHVSMRPVPRPDLGLDLTPTVVAFDDLVPAPASPAPAVSEAVLLQDG